MTGQPTPVPRMGTANLTSSSATPTMQQRIKSIGGVATPLAVSSPVRRYENYQIEFFQSFINPS